MEMPRVIATLEWKQFIRSCTDNAQTIGSFSRPIWLNFLPFLQPLCAALPPVPCDSGIDLLCKFISQITEQKKNVWGRREKGLKIIMPGAVLLPLCRSYISDTRKELTRQHRRIGAFINNVAHYLAFCSQTK